MDVARFLEKVTEIEIQQVREFRDLVKKAKRAGDARLSELVAGLTDEQAEFFADDSWKLQEVESLADQLAIVACYRVVELGTKSLIASKFGKRRARACYQIDKLKVLLCEELSVKLKQIAGFRSINEIRLLNNDIKHSGTVGKELAREFPCWVERQAFTRLDDAFERLSPDVPGYLRALAELLGTGTT